MLSSSREWKILTFFVLCLFRLLTAQVTVSGAASASNGTYTKISAAFAAINAQSQTGNAIVITVNSQPQSETSLAVLNSGTWASLIMYPTVSGIVLTGSSTSGIIQLNSADNVTIDGRVNLTGNADMTMVHALSGNHPGYICLQLAQGACNNIVRYCTFKGGSTASSTGTIQFTVSLQPTGNNNNIIEYNNFTGISLSARPSYCIHSLGTSGNANTGNIVRNNHFYDFMSRSSSSTGIYVGSNNSHWTISGNHFYETLPLVATNTSSVTFTAIIVGSVNGSGVQVLNNYVGGNGPYCSGTFSRLGGTISSFLGMSVSSDPGDTSEVQGNVIKNIYWESASGGQNTLMGFGGAGVINIGTSSPNIIGADTGNTSIVFKAISGVGSSALNGMQILNSGVQIIKNNKIGGISCENTNNNDYSNSINVIIKGIESTTIIENNLIGSTDSGTTYSLYLPTTTNKNQQVLAGIRLQYGNNIVKGNTISKLGNLSRGVGGEVTGIGALNASSIIEGNTIKDLITGVNNSAVFNSLSASGIYFSSNSGSYTGTIKGNYISNITNINDSFSTKIGGIYIKGTNGGTTVEGNFIHNVAATGYAANKGMVCGIRVVSGTTNVKNNIISLSGNNVASLFGVFDSCAVNNNTTVQFNTISISGSTDSTNSRSYSLYSALNNNARNYSNNILVNSRYTPGGSSQHYALYLKYSGAANLTLKNNAYFTLGAGSSPGYFNGVNVLSLPLVPSLDTGSYLINPRLLNPSAFTPDSFYPHVHLIGSSGTGVTTDYFGRTRKTVPTIGAIDSVLLNSGYVYLHVIPEGYLDTVNNRLRKRDMVTMYLANGTAPYAFVDSSSAMLDSVTFTSLHTFSLAPTGQYYFVVRHLNSIETWSRDSTLQFSIGDTVEYNFTDSVTKAYNNNLKLKGGKYCIYTGDVNQDGYIDISDVIQIDNTANSTPTVFTTEDLNGDGIVNYDDLLAIDANYINFVQMYSPLFW